jgi:bifunctional DNase/RNase
LQEMVIYGVSFDMVGKQPIVLLKAVDTNKFLPIWIGHPEAAAILMKLQGASTPRPMTHDLLFDMLGELEVACTRVSVTELRLAVRSGAPIFAAEDVIAESAIEFEHEVEDTEEVVDKFKEFLDQVTPEDFKGDQ